MPDDNFSELLRGMTVFRTRLVWLYVEALQLEATGRQHPCDRLRAVEKVFRVPLASARRQARLGLIDEVEIAALEEGFGLSRDWILHGDVAAMRAGIEAFCREER